MSKDYSYINDSGERIFVTYEHLVKAVQVKTELQNADHNGRCNWKKHKKMMKKIGETGSDSCESYRLLVKNFQFNSSQQIQPQSSTDTSEILSQLGLNQLAIDKREAQLYSSKIGRAKREISDKLIFSQRIIEEIKGIFEKKNPFEDIKIIEQKDIEENKLRSMILVVNDWHIGEYVDDWSFSVALKQIDLYVQKATEYAKKNGITNVYVVGNGDLIENAYMRPTQSYNIEMEFSQQIVKASEALIRLLKGLANSDSFKMVFYCGSSYGNHDRINGNKDNNLDRDSVVNVIDYIVSQFISSKPSHLTFVDLKDGYGNVILKDIHGKNLKFTHGDYEQKNDKNKIAKHNDLDRVFYDCLVLGHFHSFSARECNNGAIEVTFGCLPTGSSYSRKLKYANIPSQGFLIVDEDEITPIKVNLQV